MLRPRGLRVKRWWKMIIMRRAQEVWARERKRELGCEQERFAWQKWWMLRASRRAAFVKVGKRNRSKLSGRAARVICKKQAPGSELVNCIIMAAARSNLWIQREYVYVSLSCLNWIRICDAHSQKHDWRHKKSGMQIEFATDQESALARARRIEIKLH
jgi:hypothetical protein